MRYNFARAVDVEADFAGFCLLDELTVDPHGVVAGTGDLEVVAAKAVGVEGEVDGVGGTFWGFAEIDVLIGDEDFPVFGEVVDRDALTKTD